MPGIALQRVVGSLRTSFEAVVAGGEVVAAFEVDADLSWSGSMKRLTGWADECNHWVRPDLQRRGLGSWLVRHGAMWLRWAEVDRLLVSLAEDDDLDAWLRYYRRHGLTPVNRTRRGWQRNPARCFSQSASTKPMDPPTGATALSNRASGRPGRGAVRPDRSARR